MRHLPHKLETDMASADSCPKTGECFHPPRRQLRKRLSPADTGQVSPDKMRKLPPHYPAIYPTLDQSDFARVVPVRQAQGTLSEVLSLIHI